MSGREELTNFNNFVAVRCCTVKRSIGARGYICSVFMPVLAKSRRNYLVQLAPFP